MQEIFSLATKYSGFILLFIIFGIALFSYFSRCRNKSKSSNYKEKKLSKRILFKKKLYENSNNVAVDMPPKTKPKTLISESESSYDQNTSEDENSIEDDTFGYRNLRADIVRVQCVENYAQTDDLEKDASIQADIVPKVIFNSPPRKPTIEMESSQEDPRLEYWNEPYQDVVEKQYMDDSDKDYESCVTFVSTRSRFDEATFNEILALQSSSQRYDANDVGCLEERAYRISRWLDDRETSTRSNNYIRNLSPVRIRNFSGTSNAKFKHDRRPRFYSDDFSEINHESKHWEHWKDASPVRKAYPEQFITTQNYRILGPTKDCYEARRHRIQEIEYPSEKDGKNIWIQESAKPDIRKLEYDRRNGVERERTLKGGDRISENWNRNRFSEMKQMKYCTKQQNHGSGRQQNKLWNTHKNTSRIPDRRMESDEQHTTWRLQPKKDCIQKQEVRFDNRKCREENCVHRNQYQNFENFECENHKKLNLTGNRLEGRIFETPNRRSDNVEVYHIRQLMDTANNHYNNFSDGSEKKAVLLRNHNDGYSCDYDSSKRRTAQEGIPLEKYKLSHPKNDKKILKHDDTSMNNPKNFEKKSPAREPENISRPVPAREKKRLSNYLKHQFNNLDDDTLRKSFRMVQDLKETLEKRGDTKLH
ncbi:hypothetical protein JTE90_013988 [Oedothorax gibbosus]|uniref:Uncharacterized protein n=1 Tax=Oedothorax gibbosus TaxID=931172 RepID=A0AAV6UDX1_9ARAC|nr:hypothetical protein JTE90_013988 [Oedothorax gibbosus]